MAIPLLPTVLQNRMTIALDHLKKADPLLVSTIAELRQQDLTTEADALQVVLDDLRTETANIIAAVNI